MIKNIKFLLLIILSSMLLTNCGSVKKAFDPQNKNNSEEFLVEKKSPLSIPPSFKELPVPSNEKADIENDRLTHGFYIIWLLISLCAHVE